MGFKKGSKSLSKGYSQLEEIQLEIYETIRTKVFYIKEDLERGLVESQEKLEREDLDLVGEELINNILELNLNINTTIINFQRISSLELRHIGGNEYRKKRNYMKKVKLFFLLDRTIRNVYGKKLGYLVEELKNALAYLEEDLRNFIYNIYEGDLGHKIKEISREHFRVTSDINYYIDEINETIDDVATSINGVKDRNINLSFLLVSAFLSVILFFPEFNNMINLRDEEVSFEEKIDSLIYEKVIEEASLEDLLDLKTLREDEYDEVNLAIVEIIERYTEVENENLKKEKNRINLFLKILLTILLPFIIWIVFIAV